MTRARKPATVVARRKEPGGDTWHVRMARESDLVRRLDRLERKGNGSGEEAAAITHELIARARARKGL